MAQPRYLPIQPPGRQGPRSLSPCPRGPASGLTEARRPPRTRSSCHVFHSGTTPSNHRPASVARAGRRHPPRTEIPAARTDNTLPNGCCGPAGDRPDQAKPSVPTGLHAHGQHTRTPAGAGPANPYTRARGSFRSRNSPPESERNAPSEPDRRSPRNGGSHSPWQDHRRLPQLASPDRVDFAGNLFVTITERTRIVTVVPSDG